MDESHPLAKEYRESINFKLKSIRKVLETLKVDYSIRNLEEMQNDFRKLAASAPLYGFEEAGAIAHELEIELIEKVKNFQRNSPPAKWFEQIEALFNDMERAFSLNKEVAMVQEKKQVVIVDDDDDLLKLLSYEFQNIGFNVKSFTTGKAALNFLLVEGNLKNVSLLILDRVLPDMDGLEILKKFQQMFPKKVPTLILSVLADEQNVLQGLETGAVDYVAKPFSVFLLLQKAMNLMAPK